MSDMLVKMVENEKAILRIEYDQDALSPREDDNLGTMTCWHRRYNLGDDHRYDEPRDLLQGLVSEYYTGESYNLDDWTNERLMALVEKHYIIRTVHMYEHSMVALSTNSFRGRAHHAEWDSGTVGYVYVSKKAIRDEWGVKRISPKLRKLVEKNMNREVETYGEYVNGSVFGFFLEKKIPICTDGECEGTCTCGSENVVIETEEVESCWGFYGWDFKNNGLADHIPNEYKELVAAL